MSRVPSLARPSRARARVRAFPLRCRPNARQPKHARRSHGRCATCECRRAQRAQVTERATSFLSRVFGRRVRAIALRGCPLPGVGNRRVDEEQSASFWQKCVFFFHANERTNKNKTFLLVQHAPHARVRRARQVIVVLQILPRFPAEERVSKKRSIPRRKKARRLVSSPAP